MNATELYLYLTACAVNGENASTDEADFDALWQMTQGHNMTALVAQALTHTKAFRNAGAEEQKRWKNALNNSIKKTMLFDAERKKIISFLEQNKIWYMPLKGAVINGFYKSYGTREFADNDILFDPAFSDEVKQFMLERGYVFRSDEFAADEYSKKPFFNFEMHRALFEKNDNFNTYLSYYDNVKERLRKDGGNNYGFHFTDDDFYIYFIVHAYKHYDSRGTGFRTVADEYVLLDCGKLKLNFKYIDNELEKLGIKAFEHTLRSLAAKLFSNPAQMEKNLRKLSEEENKMLFFILSCGTFGDMENLFLKEYQATMDGNNESSSKIRYYLKRIFPNISRFKYSHPFVYKHKIVYPFFLIYRMIVNPIKHRRYIKQELKTISKIKK